MTEAILVMYGRIEKKAEDYFASASVTEPFDLASLIQPKTISWDDLGNDVIAELMVWENASAQDLRYLDGLAK